VSQPDRVEVAVGVGYTMPCGSVQYPRSQEPLVGCLGSVVFPGYLGPMPCLADELHAGLKEVVV